MSFEVLPSPSPETYFELVSSRFRRPWPDRSAAESVPPASVVRVARARSLRGYPSVPIGPVMGPAIAPMDCGPSSVDASVPAQSASSRGVLARKACRSPSLRAQAVGPPSPRSRASPPASSPVLSPCAVIDQDVCRPARSLMRVNSRHPTCTCVLDRFFRSLLQGTSPKANSRPRRGCQTAASRPGAVRAMNRIVFAMRRLITFLILVVALGGGGVLGLSKMRADSLPPLNPPNMSGYLDYIGERAAQMKRYHRRPVSSRIFKSTRGSTTRRIRRSCSPAPRRWTSPSPSNLSARSARSGTSTSAPWTAAISRTSRSKRARR